MLHQYLLSILLHGSIRTRTDLSAQSMLVHISFFVISQLLWHDHSAIFRYGMEQLRENNQGECSRNKSSIGSTSYLGHYNDFIARKLELLDRVSQDYLRFATRIDL